MPIAFSHGNVAHSNVALSNVALSNVNVNIFVNKKKSRLKHFQNNFTSRLACRGLQ